MEEVAATVGVTKPLLYTYFGNKERLCLACMEPAAEALVDRDRSAWRVLFDAERAAELLVRTIVPGLP
jgi:AcrR family transcriptional regulator